MGRLRGRWASWWGRWAAISKNSTECPIFIIFSPTCSAPWALWYKCYFQYETLHFQARKGYPITWKDRVGKMGHLFSKLNGMSDFHNFFTYLFSSFRALWYKFYFNMKPYIFRPERATLLPERTLKISIQIHLYWRGENGPKIKFDYFTFKNSQYYYNAIFKTIPTN